MAAYLFPVLSSAELVACLHDIMGESFSDEDFKSPQPTRIQNLYAAFLETIVNTQLDRINQPQWTASQVVMHPELYDGIFPIMNLAIAMQRLMVACQVTDFKLTDLLNPKPKRTRRFVSALINFWRFSVEREEAYNNIRQEIQGSIAERNQLKEKINELKEKINLMKMTRAEEEVKVNQLLGIIDELDGKMMPQQQEQASIQRELTRLKAALAEKVALLEKHKLSILDKQESVRKLQAQVVQSPERMKADISRMHSVLASRKEAKNQKGQRLQELRGQNENCQVLLHSSEQGAAMIAGIDSELEKLREAQSGLEEVRDHIQSEKDQLRDQTAHEGHLSRQRDTKQEKLAKLQLQHQHTVTALRENVQQESSSLEEYCQEQERKLSHVCLLNDQKNSLKKQMTDKENEHAEVLKRKRDKYDNLLIALDSYHKDLAVGWEQADPHQFLEF
ncbi:kinetochore protein Nuf2-A-like [Diadema setosum]|uniref:kinetochore protein Nuf2-A-like n=2 Tax=Diadema TaxID=31174 RepID=UPI003B3BB0B1